ncbi:MAG: DUF2283 domain-containing protein [Phycisphaeraceae bacterium]|nr:DUF2283 domain-containing protein [Phycisphaeraceae bacterium]
MKVIYDPRTDTLTVRFKPGEVAESDESKPGLILDFDEQGGLLALEILDASKHVEETRSVQIEVTAA